uniref:Uncharacterized protein n=1 Tax=Cebus imitator TaxID=2715852 RepID=A0A2K5RHT9_CEBIM
MAGILLLVAQRPPGRLQTMTKGVESLICTDWIHHKFTKSRIPDKVFQASPEDHEKYGGDPPNPHKLHIVTRKKSTRRRPYWEKDIIKIFYAVGGNVNYFNYVEGSMVIPQRSRGRNVI